VPRRENRELRRGGVGAHQNGIYLIWYLTWLSSLDSGWFCMQDDVVVVRFGCRVRVI
jgi:hypothetical protein